MTAEKEVREVVLAPSTLEEMNSFHPAPEEKAAIKNVLSLLKSDSPGYEIAFYLPKTFRVDVGRFRIHYSIGERAEVSYIGVY
jgi:hypothetical protein